MKNFTRSHSFKSHFLKTVWILPALLFLNIHLYGQVTAYTFSTSTGNSLDLMSGSTQLIGSGVDDSPSPLTNIGFTFNYNGVDYTTFSVTPDGFLKLGTVTTSQFSNNITSTLNLPKLMPLWDDLATGSAAGGGKVHYVLNGTAPNRILVVEWFVTVPRATTGAANSRFQAWLYETTNVIEYRYGTGGNPTSASVGINSTAPVQFQSITTSTHAVSTSSANNSNNAWPGDGRMYQFTPPLPCTGMPDPGNTVVSSNLACSGVNFTLSLSNQVQGTGVIYQWQSSPDGMIWMNISGANSATLTTSLTATTSYRCIVTCTNSGLAGTSTPVTVDLAPFYLCYCNSRATSTADTKIDEIYFNSVQISSSPANTCETYTIHPTPLAGIFFGGSSYPLQIVNGSCSGTHFSARAAVYIDYNRNGIYESNELAFVSPVTTGLNTIAPADIVIPLNVSPGLTGMRVILRETTLVPPACGTYNWGETEDFVIELCTGWYLDADGDGFGDPDMYLPDCGQPQGYVTNNLDCNDSNPNVNPVAVEICNGIDDNCDGNIDDVTATYVGNVTLTSQAQVNAFLACYTGIQGNLTISGAGINNLGPLANLEFVTGSVSIQYTLVTSMNGLNSLTSIGQNLIISYNQQLTSLAGLNNLANVGMNLLVLFNTKLSDCCAIQDLVNEVNGKNVGGLINIAGNKTGCESIAGINTACNAPLIGTAGGNNFAINHSEIQGILLFPNPASGEVNVAIRNSFETGSIRLLDLQGRVLRQQDLEGGAQNYQISLDQLPAGTYFVLTMLDGEVFSEKLSVK